MHYISIYPLTEITNIKDYSGDFLGITYDSEEKLKVAREMARFLAEVKPHDQWESYYPTNEEMTEIVKMLNELMAEKAIKYSTEISERNRYGIMVDFFMTIKNMYGITTYEEMIREKKAVKRIIRNVMKD